MLSCQPLPKCRNILDHWLLLLACSPPLKAVRTCSSQNIPIDWSVQLEIVGRDQCCSIYWIHDNKSGRSLWL